MRTKQTLLSILVTAVFLFSCKDKDVTTPTEERIEANHPTEENTVSPSEDSLTVIKDSVIDHNMKDQSDTHGRNVDNGK